MVPMNLLTKDRSADYIITGVWGQGAIKEAEKGRSDACRAQRPKTATSIAFPHRKS
jgi:phosphoserine aminotransferase